MGKIRNKITGKSSPHKTYNSPSKMRERVYKLVMLAGFGVAYKGLKAWLKTKKRRMRH